MSETQKIDLNLIELVSLAAKIVDQLFIKAPKDKAKAAFKEIKQGHTFPLGSIKVQDKLESSLQLALDYSEFCGPGFNFDVFANALKSILTQISQKFQAKADLNIMTSEEGSVLIHLPGMVQLNEQLNVMVMAFDIGEMEKITIRLMFVEPEQYDAAKQQKD